MIRRVALGVLTAVAMTAWPAFAQDRPPDRPPDRPKVGVLKLTSSAPIFLGVEKGFFKEFGVEPELVYFQAAAPIATALAAGQIDVGATGLTAALYNIVLGGERLWIVADKGREWPDYRLTAIVVHFDRVVPGRLNRRVRAARTFPRSQRYLFKTTKAACPTRRRTRAGR